MIDRDFFIDAVDGIDGDLLTAHIQRKIPTKAQKIRRYVMAAAAYAAAVIAVAIILPFIIGGGDEPTPAPGDDPIVTETHFPITEDPDLTEIKASEINEVYNGVDPESLPVNVSLDEVNAIISAAVQAYEDYDIVVLEDGETIRTLPKNPHITFSELGDGGMMTDAAMEYLEYNKNVFYVIRDALASRFPEDVKWLTSNKESGEDLLIMDVEAMRENERRNEENPNSPVSITPDMLVIQHSFVQQISFMSIDTFVSINDGETVLYPSGRDLDILNILKFGDVRSGEMDPTATASADGLELSVFLMDRTILDTSVSATVVLENTGDSDVTLWQGYLGDYIDEVTVYENGVIRPDKSAQSGYSESEQTRVLKPGEYIIYRDAISMTKEDDTPAINSSWEYEVKAEYIPNGGDEHETLTVRISMPRDTVENTVPDPDTITVGADGKSMSFDSVSEYYYYELVTRRINNLLSEGDTVLVYRESQDLAMSRLKDNFKYAELVYGEESSLYLNGVNTGIFTRILFVMDVDGEIYMILGADEEYSQGEVYSISMSEEILSAIMDIIESEYTETSPAVTTTPPPAAVPRETAVTVSDPEEPDVVPSGNSDNAVSTTTVANTPVVTTTPPVTEPAVTDPSPVPDETDEATTTTRKPAATTQKVTYPDPYVSNNTATSVTKTFYGCDYTLSVDKAKCEPGDIITVTVTLENKGQSRIDLYDYYYSYDRYNGVTHKNFLDRVAFKVSGYGAYDYSGEGYTKRTSLMPGKTMSYTTKIDTTDAYVKSSWVVECEIYFTVDGEMNYQFNSLRIEHDGCVNWPLSVEYMYNPFDYSRYENAFKGNGEIVITFSPEASEYWEKYLGPEYFGYYGILGLPEYSPEHDPYEIEEIKLHEDTAGPRVTVSIFLKDKDEFRVNSAVNFLHQISEENDGAIAYAYPVEANYFVK